MARPPLIAVCGASRARPEDVHNATEVGEQLARAGAVVLCGGLGGVMESVAAAARHAGGTVIGLLPGLDAGEASPGVTVAIPTGLGEMRNALLARACRAMIAIGGGYGTLSEIAFALRLGRPVTTLSSWDIAPPPGADLAAEMPHAASGPSDAVAWALARALRSSV